MDIKQLITFKTLSQEQNYIKASEKLNYAPSTLAKHIHSLEDELGCTLVEYRNGKIELTPYGDKLMKYAENILLEYLKIQSAFSYDTSHKQNLRVVGGEFIVGYTFGEFFAKHTNTVSDYTLSVFTACCTHATAWLEQRMADVAFVIMIENRKIPGFITVPLFKEKMCLMASHNHPLAKEKNIHASQLSDCSFAFTYDDCCFVRQFEKMLSRYTDTIDSICLGSVNSVVHTVKNDNKLCLVPCGAAQELQEAGLVTLDWNDSFELFNVILIKEDGNPPAVAQLVESAQEYVKRIKNSGINNQIVLL